MIIKKVKRNVEKLKVGEQIVTPDSNLYQHNNYKNQSYVKICKNFQFYGINRMAFR